MTASTTAFTLIKAARLIAGDHGEVLQGAAALFENGRIARIGSQAEVRAPDGAQVVEADYGDATILPGLVDCHTHLCAPGDGTPGDDVAREKDDILLLQAAKNARTILHSGVTTIRENGAKNSVSFSLKEGIRRGLAAGPRMVICGRPLTITGGHMGYFGAEADGLDGVRREVRRLLKEGADYIKIAATGGSTRTSDPNRASYTVEELRAITDEAHRHGKLTAAHCASAQGVENSLDAEVDMIIHCVFNEPDGSYRYRPDLVARLAQANAWVNPTLYVVQTGIVRLERKQSEEGLTPAEEALLENTKRDLDTRVAAVGRMTADGVRMVSGSDSPWGYYAPGEFVHEIEMLARAGLSTTDALLSGSVWSADSIGVGRRAGILAEGRGADALVVRGDASRDIRTLWDVLDVYQQGERVERGVG